jgi:hypothetical protein
LVNDVWKGTRLFLLKKMVITGKITASLWFLLLSIIMFIYPANGLTHYEKLGVPPNADAKQIKSAFRSLALKVSGRFVSPNQLNVFFLKFPILFLTHNIDKRPTPTKIQARKLRKNFLKYLSHTKL